MEQADQIIVPHGKFPILLDICEKFSDKDIILDVPEDSTVEYRTVAMCAEQLKEGAELYVRLHKVNIYLDVAQCRKHNVKFFYSEPVKTFYELSALRDLGVSYVYVDAPLFFDMDEVKKAGVPVRLVPNRCYPRGSVPHANGLHGTWIRPEKLDIYEPYAETAEFLFDTAKQELTLFKVYFEDKAWPADMDTLYYGFNMHLDNRLVYEGLDEMRLTCKQKCETPRMSCLMCNKVARFERIGRDWAEQVVAQEREKEKET